MKYYLPLFLFLFTYASCMDDDDSMEPTVNPDCENPILIADVNTDPTGDSFMLGEVSVDGLCLTVEIGASGCSDEGWTMELRTNGDVGESDPTTTNARLIFDDQVPGGATCLAFFSPSFTFDLTPYLDAGSLPTNLTLTGPDGQETTVFIE